MYSDDEQLLTRIVTDPGIFGGKPIIRGHRLAVEHVIGKLAAGETVDELLEDFPFLQMEDIRACLLFAYQAITSSGLVSSK